MMWSKNTNGNLMIGKGKERKGGRGGEGRETRNWNGRLSGDLAEHSRGRSWSTELSGEFPFRLAILVNIVEARVKCFST